MGKKANWYKIKAAKDGGAARIDLYGYLVSWDLFDDEVSAAGFIDELKKIDADAIDVHINSPGGEVAQGLAIYTALRQHPAAITTFNDAEAASIASVVFMAGDRRVMAGHAYAMIHDPWGRVTGNAEEIRKYADTLEFNADILAAIYADRSGGEKPDFSAAMSEETWYNAHQALAAGLATEISEALPVAACRIEPGRYAKTPECLLSKKVTKMAKHTKPNATPADDVNANGNETVIEPNANPAPAADPAEASATIAGAVDSALRAENERRRAIMAAFKPFGATHEELRDQCVNNLECTAAAAGQKLLAALATQKPIAGGRVEMGHDQRDKFLDGATLALSVRCQIKNADAAANRQNEFRGYSLLEMARHALQRANVATAGLDRRRVVGMAFTHSDSDFPALLENIAEKSLLQGWDGSEVTYPQWTVPGVLTDYKEAGRVGLEAAPFLSKVEAGGEFRYATLGSTGEKIQLAKYGNLFSIDREAIINDDTNAFSQIPMLFGDAARATINLAVYNVLINNAAMADGTALFHADHGNLLTGAAPATDSVDAMRVAMGTQKAIGSDAGSNTGKQKRSLNIRLAYLLTPMALEGATRVVMTSQNYVNMNSVDANIPNSVAGIAKVVSDALLDEASATAWYGAASRRTVEVAYLDGDEAPFLESQQGWTVDGVSYKVRTEAGVKALDWRGLAKNPGV